MTRLETLTEALAYVEASLRGDLTPDAVAAHCHYSLSAMQKLFRHAFHMGIADYIARRRLTLASRELVSTEDPVLDIALRYGYESHEVFTRAFRRIWGVTPSKFRRERSFTDIFPRLRLPTGGLDMPHRQHDITELYDTLRALHGTWALVFDTCHLEPINREIGHAAGDLVIAESLRRIDAAKAEDMVLFRIGGDEYVLLTGLQKESAAQALCGRILQANGKPIVCEGREVPVSLRDGRCLLDTARRLNYAELFNAFDRTIRS